jgi:HPt (histidine-containing phosphotransfer) domain-containing protein
MTGGTVENYRTALIVYCRDGYAKIKEIEECLSTNNLRLFTTYVHALKSASASIGAVGLSVAAGELETAGLRGDMNYIRMQAQKFLMEFNTMLHNIEDALSLENGSLDLASSLDMEALKSALDKLKAALSGYETPVINETSKSLQSFTDDPIIGDTIHNILQYVLIGVYDKAVSLIDRLLSELSEGRFS